MSAVEGASTVRWTGAVTALAGETAESTGLAVRDFRGNATSRKDS